MTWNGALDPETWKPAFVDDSHALADAARAGDWDAVFALLDAARSATANTWRIGGTSGFTPLHQAAWHGASTGVVERLVALGGWRSLPDAEGALPADIAEARGHGHLRDALAVPGITAPARRRWDAWNTHVDALVRERTRTLGEVAYRPVPTEIIELENIELLSFPFPGMYGGFSMSVHRGRLHVESWSRVVGGSGQAHVITESGCVLVEDGFV